MSIRSWLKLILQGVFLIGTASAAALWIAALTAKCEGFGCLGVGAIVGLAFIIHLASASVGGILIWRERADGRLPKWLIVLEALHLLPVLWFGGLMVLA